MATAGSNGTGVWASSPNHIAVRASTNSGWAIQAWADTGPGIYAESVHYKAIEAVSYTGDGLTAYSQSGYAGNFQGSVLFAGYQDVIERSDPPAPPNGIARVFARDNGLGKTQLCVRFPTGAVQVVATEP